jgi:branched-chain amino acid transport system substrate-binding protein
MGKFRSAVAALVAVTFLAAGCGDDGDSAEGDSSKPFTVLMVADFTGPGKAYGDQFLLGAQAAADYINEEKGGIEGREVVIKTESDNFDATQAASVLTKYLSSNDPPDLTFAGGGDAEVGATFPILQRNGLLGWAGNDSGGLLQNGGAKDLDLQFSTQAPTIPVTEKVAEWIKEQGFTKVGILQAENDYAGQETEYAEKAFADAGLTDTVVTFSQDSVDLTPQVQQLQDSGAEVVFFEGLTQNFGYAIKARTKLGWTAPWIVDLAASSLDLTTVATPEDLVDVSEINFRPSVAGADVPGLDVMRKYAADHTDIAPLDAVPVHIAGLAWDGVLMVANAAEQAGSTKAEDIAKALEDFGDGATDPNYLNYADISYTAEDHTPVNASPDDYPITPVGPIKGGQVQTAG